MITSIKDFAVLHNGVHLPWLGLGVWKMEDGEEVEKAVKAAIKLGYRSIDTASYYQNEIGVGKAAREVGMPREKLFITTKVWNADQGYESTLKAFEESREKLGLEYLDLYLIHWPVKGKYRETWKALEKLYKEGLVRAIGVSNFQIHHLEDVMEYCEVKPMVNQVEFHPYLAQRKLRAFSEKHHIQTQAWSPLMQGEVIHDPLICEIGKKYDKSPVQIVLRWDIQNKVVTIPKSSNVHRMIENATIFDFELAPDDMLLLNALDKSARIGPNPDDFDF